MMTNYLVGDSIHSLHDTAAIAVLIIQERITSNSAEVYMAHIQLTKGLLCVYFIIS